MLTLLIAATAFAADIVPYFTYDDYPDGEAMDGTDGWVSGFEEDPWFGYISESTGRTYVLPYTDTDSGEYPGDWGDGGAMDNWLVNRDVQVEDGVIRSYFFSYDDDTLGLVFNQSDPNNYYLLIMVGDGGDDPLGRGGPYTAIVKISGGAAEVLADTRDTYEIEPEALSAFSLRVDDGEILFSFWETWDDDWADETDWPTPDWTLDATDGAPLAAGAAGFYSYNAGGWERETAVLFGAAWVWQVDEDVDGVADDDDNCEEVSNADQADADGDSIGDACDEDGGNDTGGDSGGGDEGGGDSGDDGGGDEGGGDGSGLDPDALGDYKLTSCACSSTGGVPTGIGWISAVLGLVFVRRRARSIE